MHDTHLLSIGLKYLLQNGVLLLRLNRLGFESLWPILLGLPYYHWMW